MLNIAIQSLECNRLILPGECIHLEIGVDIEEDLIKDTIYNEKQLASIYCNDIFDCLSVLEIERLVELKSEEVTYVKLNCTQIFRYENSEYRKKRIVDPIPFIDANLLDDELIQLFEQYCGAISIDNGYAYKMIDVAKEIDLSDQQIMLLLKTNSISTREGLLKQYLQQKLLATFRKHQLN